MAYNRDRNSRGGGFKPRFNDRGASRGPVTMHQAVCDNCGKSCEVPFRPTSGKPIFCSNCFEDKRGSDSRGSGRSFDRPSFADKQMFDAVCDECANKCQVSFRPSGDKPVYCSNCFGDKKNSGVKSVDQFEALNAKLDKILGILQPITTEVEAEVAQIEVEPKAEKKTKTPKKKAE